MGDDGWTRRAAGMRLRVTDQPEQSGRSRGQHQYAGQQMAQMWGSTPAVRRHRGGPQLGRIYRMGPCVQRRHQAALHERGAAFLVMFVNHRGPSKCLLSASRARLAVDLTVPRDRPSVAAICASVRSDQYRKTSTSR